MLGALKRMFGGETGPAERRGDTIEHEGFSVTAAPIEERGRWLTAGLITKEIGGETKEHRFIRADTHSTFEEAATFSLQKGRQIVDELGTQVFD